MANYRRPRIAGGSYFFTVTLLDRGSNLLVMHIDLLRQAVRRVKAVRSFRIDAWAVLPDHMHCVWTLPEGDSNYSARWRDIKTTFSRSIAKGEYIDPVRKKNGERGIWQRRFWEHAIRDDADYWAHIDYVHLNTGWSSMSATGRIHRSIGT